MEIRVQHIVSKAWQTGLPVLHWQVDLSVRQMSGRMTEGIVILVLTSVSLVVPSVLTLSAGSCAVYSETVSFSLLVLALFLDKLIHSFIPTSSQLLNSRQCLVPSGCSDQSALALTEIPPETV